MSSTITALTSGGGLAMAGDTSGQLELKTNNGTTAVTIDTAQNVGIGGTPSAWVSAKVLQLGTDTGLSGFGNETELTTNAYWASGSAWKYAVSSQPSTQYTQYNGTHVWSNATSGTAGNSITWSERMRIDSSGNLLVGTTSNSGGSIISANVSGYYALTVANTSTGANTYGMLVSMASSGSPQYLFIGRYAGTNQFLINNVGNVTNTNNSYGAISDVKLKENIVDATSKLEDLCKVKVRQYNLKSSPDQKQIGVVAQELEQVFPAMIEESVDRDEENNDLGTSTKTVKYSVFVPMLIKAIQELNAKVDAQAAEIKALKGVA